MTNLKQEVDRFFGPFGELKLDEFPALGDEEALKALIRAAVTLNTSRAHG